jgi:cell division protein FtsI/penicillin-binding protein 2
MNLWILLLILFIIFILYFLFVIESDKKEENAINIHVKESKIKYNPPREDIRQMKTISLQKQDFYMGFSNEYKNPKWGGVQRNPVCCRINYTNRSFYDSEMYP